MLASLLYRSHPVTLSSLEMSGVCLRRPGMSEGVGDDRELPIFGKKGSAVFFSVRTDSVGVAAEAHLFVSGLTQAEAAGTLFVKGNCCPPSLNFTSRGLKTHTHSVTFTFPSVNL